MSAREMEQTEFSNTEFIVDKLIPVGLIVLSGAPKIGKSWLLLLWSECISMGFPLFGFTCQKAPVLYYTLEDSIKRCKYRLKKIGSHWGDNLFFSEKAHGAAGIIADVKATGARVVIIDTFGAFAAVEDINSYQETTDKIREIKEIADVLQVAVIVVHHTNKGGGVGNDWTREIMGSQGIIGAADNIISLQRKRGEDHGKLVATGRDISDCYIEIKWADGLWEKS